MSASGQKNGLRAISSQSHLARSIRCGPIATSAAAHRHARHDLARHRAGGDPRRGLARGGASAAAIVAQAVFGVIGVVGMAGPVEIADVGIVLGALIDIVDHERDRRTGRHRLAGRIVGDHAREDFDLVGLAGAGVVNRDWPGRRRSRSRWMSAAASGIRGGQPSITQPIAAPWLSPNVVTRNRWPKVLWDIKRGLSAGLVACATAGVNQRKSSSGALAL